MSQIKTFYWFMKHVQTLEMETLTSCLMSNQSEDQHCKATETSLSSVGDDYN